MKTGVPSLLPLFCPFPNLQVRRLQAAGPHRARRCGAEGAAVQVLRRRLRGLARRCGAHQQLHGGRGPQPAAAVPKHHQPGEDAPGGTRGGTLGWARLGGTFKLPLSIIPSSPFYSTMTNRLNPAGLRTLPAVGTRRVRPDWGLGKSSGFPVHFPQLTHELPGG